MQKRKVKFEQVEWWAPPGHVSSFSKLIAGPKGVAKSEAMDFRISIYQPAGYVETHAHEKGEHVWFILRGRGLVTLDDHRYTVRSRDTIHIPAGTEHSLRNTSGKPLYLMTILVPPE